MCAGLTAWRATPPPRDRATPPGYPAPIEKIFHPLPKCAPPIPPPSPARLRFGVARSWRCFAPWEGIPGRGGGILEGRPHYPSKCGAGGRGPLLGGGAEGEVRGSKGSRALRAPLIWDPIWKQAKGRPQNRDWGGEQKGVVLQADPEAGSPSGPSLALKKQEYKGRIFWGWVGKVGSRGGAVRDHHGGRGDGV